MNILAYLLAVLSAETAQKHEIKYGTINIVHDVEIVEVRIKSGEKFNTIKLDSSNEDDFIYENGKRKSVRLFGEFSKYCLSLPYVYRIPFSPSGSTSIIEFINESGKVLFHTVVTKEGFFRRSYLSEFKSGSYEDRDNGENLEFSTTGLAMASSSEKYFIISHNITEKVKLDKSVEACELLKFMDDLNAPMNDLYKEYMALYSIIDSSDKDQVKKDQFKTSIDGLVKANFVNLQYCQKGIKISYNTKQYEEKLILNTDVSLEVSKSHLENINTTVNNQVKNTEKCLGNFYETFYDKGFFRKMLDKFTSFFKTYKTYSILKEVTKKKNKFIGSLKVISADNKTYIVERNKRFVETFSQNTYNGQEKVTYNHNFINLYKEYTDLSLFDRKVTLNKEVSISNSEGVNEKPYTNLEENFINELKGIEGYMRLGIDLDVFNEQPCIRTNSFILENKISTQKTLNSILADINQYKDNLSDVEGAVKELVAKERADEKLDKILVEFKAFFESYRKFEKVSITNLLKRTMKQVKISPGTVEGQASPTSAQLKTDNKTNAAAASTPQPQGSGRWFSWISNKMFVIIIILLVAAVAITVGVVFYLKYYDELGF